MTKLFSRKDMLSRAFGARKAKRLEGSLKSSGTRIEFPYNKKTNFGLKGHFVFVDTTEGHYFWWDIAEKLEDLGYVTTED